MLPHVLALDIPKTGSGQYPLDALPVGFIVEAAKVVQVVEQQGVYVDIGIDGVTGFVHVSSSTTFPDILDFKTCR
jgi:rRNA biogenesis protein RRP5